MKHSWKCFKTATKTQHQHCKIFALTYFALNWIPLIHKWLAVWFTLEQGHELLLPVPSTVTSHPKQLQLTAHPNQKRRTRSAVTDTSTLSYDMKPLGNCQVRKIKNLGQLAPPYHSLPPTDLPHKIMHNWLNWLNTVIPREEPQTTYCWSPGGCVSQPLHTTHLTHHKQSWLPRPTTGAMNAQR